MVIAIARFLLGDLSPEQFLAQRVPIIAAYNAAATDNHGAYFELSGELRFLHKYTVSFDVDGGNDIGDQIVNYGGTAHLPEEPVKHGYNFAGWFADENRSIEFDFDEPVTCDTVVYAKWLEAQYWSYEINPGTQLADFRIGVVDVTEATHFELHYEGAGDQRALIGECISGVDIAPTEDPANFEIWLFSSDVNEVPFAIATCDGVPGDNYGKLVIHDTWSVRETPYSPTSEFSVYTTYPGAAYYELHFEGFEDPIDRMPVGIPATSASVCFTEPSQLIVKFFASEEAEEPLVIAGCSGEDGDSFGRLIY